MFSPGLVSYIETTLDENDISLLLLSNNINGHYDKERLFHKNDCDEEDYHDVKSIEAGFSYGKYVKNQLRQLKIG